jgi:hypothetical protein
VGQADLARLRDRTAADQRRYLAPQTSLICPHTGKVGKEHYRNQKGPSSGPFWLSWSWRWSSWQGLRAANRGRERPTLVEGIDGVHPFQIGAA